MASIDELTDKGLFTKDNLTLVSDLKTGFQEIYSQNGEILNFDSNTPDGQLIEIVAELGTVLRELITEVYNSIDPDKCVGSVQDNRYQINYLTRKTGAYTIQNIAITTNKTVSLQGLDASYNDPEASAYAVSDNNGNIWYLVDSSTLTAGTTLKEFRAKEKGIIEPVIGTIVNQVTIIEGVIKVINNVGATSIGYEQESDSDFRIRRNRSTEKRGENNFDTIWSNLLALDGVTEVNGWQNNTNSTDSTGTPAHSIWFIVKGGANTDIADVIYSNIGGAGTRGSVTVPMITSSLQTININFDRETVIALYIKFDLQVITDLGEINQDKVKENIAENLIYTIGEEAETSRITEVCADALLADGGNAYALNVQISTGGTATASTTSTSISNLAVDVITFQAACSDTAGSYVFSYTASGWQLSGNDVNIDNYGITYTGTPTLSDTITISYTASVWKDYIATPTMAGQFVTDKNKIIINTGS